MFLPGTNSHSRVKIYPWDKIFRESCSVCVEAQIQDYPFLLYAQRAQSNNNSCVVDEIEKDAWRDGLYDRKEALATEKL
jgi:hypothetical protein